MFDFECKGVIDIILSKVIACFDIIMETLVSPVGDGERARKPKRSPETWKKHLNTVDRYVGVVVILTSTMTNGLSY